MMICAGLPSGPSNQVGSLPWSVQQLPHQAVLHVKYSHHTTECSCFQPLCHISGDLLDVLMKCSYLSSTFIVN